MTTITERRGELTDRELALVRSIEHDLVRARADKINGELKFRIMLRDGGVMDVYKETLERVTVK